MTLPVAIFHFGYLLLELMEGVHFHKMYQFILETWGQTFTKEVVKCGMVPMNQGSILNLTVYLLI